MHIFPFGVIVVSFPIIVGISQGNQSATFEKEKTCLGCHGEKIIQNNSHFIESDGDCLFCHEIQENSILHKKSTISNSQNCISCHHEKETSTPNTTHTRLPCIDCHDPHGSTIRHNFVRPEIDLCSESCHTDNDLGLSHPVGANVIDQNTGSALTCISTCHSIHNPLEEKSLQQVGINLCGSCHADKY